MTNIRLFTMPCFIGLTTPSKTTLKSDTHSRDCRAGYTHFA